MNFYGGEDQSIVDSVITNGDDCISVVPSGDPATALCVNHPEQCRGGSLLVHNVTCTGSHGLSIGRVRGSRMIRSPQLMGLTSLGLKVAIPLYGILLLNAILWQDFLGLAYPCRR